MASPPTDNTAATRMRPCRPNVLFAISPSRLAPRRARPPVYGKRSRCRSMVLGTAPWCGKAFLPRVGIIRRRRESVAKERSDQSSGEPRNRFNARRAIAAGAWSGIAKTELTLISHNT